MDRRTSLVALLALGTGLPLAAGAQQAKRSYRLTLFLGGTARAAERHREAVSERLAAHGFVAGSNLQLEVRRGGIEQWNVDTARMIVATKPDVVLVESTRLAMALAEASATLPIVFSGVDDPVEAGLVKSFARPGGRTTGVYYSQVEVASKRLELLRELLPHARRVAIAASFGDSGVRHTMPTLREVAAQLGFELIELDGTWNFGFGPSLELVARSKPEAVMMLQPYAFYGMEEVVKPVIRFGTEQRIPVLCWESRVAELGALLSYGVSLAHELSRAADQVARVLKGASPASIPVDQATSYELVVNQKTAKLLGVVVPPSILVRADRLIR